MHGEIAAESKPQRPRVARNTAIFAVATSLSRAAGLAREVVASSYFGTSGPFSAFTLAFQIPNLIRALVADAALSAAFVPVFTELLEKGRKREAFKLASTLALLILIGLSALTALFILFAGVIMPLFIGKGFTPQLTDLTIGLSQVLFPILILLGLNGLVVGILNARDHFAIPAIAPVVWNLVIIAALVLLRPQFSGVNEIYAYAIGVLIATFVQLAMAIPVLPRVGFRFEFAFNWRDPHVTQVFRLMVPVMVGLGVINIDLLINSSVGSMISAEAPRAIDAAFRIYMLPQGIFSVAVATVLFPALGRLVARRDTDGLRKLQAQGVRTILLFLMPAATIMAALAEPIVRLVYQRGAFGSSSTQLVATALVWFSLSLPFAGVNLLLTRTFFAIRRAWVPTGLAFANLALNTALSFALYKPLGIAGPVIGTAVASIGMTFGQLWFLRRELGGIEIGSLFSAFLRIGVASALTAGVSYLVWSLLEAPLGVSFIAQLVEVGVALIAGGVVFVLTVLSLRVAEARTIVDRIVTTVRGRNG
ncbi:MAG: murein biosynthesis integral membrane protein MurJ [Solirubrobacterales bacterium]|nr:murein biosynthesis integral membrane protein MurJ [Solirubrobacterales bacterium]